MNAQTYRQELRKDMTADDYVKLNRIRDEQRELKSRMEELVNNLSK